MKVKGIRKRSKVLQYSLKLEKFVSYELAIMLDIDNYENSKSLGNGSSSLSVNQKLNILLDIGNILKNEKMKIEFFMSIRNQFMHNIDANSFEYVFDRINGLEPKLKKFYPELFSTGLEKEEIFEKCIDKLFNDSIEILLDQKGNKEKKIYKDAMARTNEIRVKHYRTAIEDFTFRVKDFFSNQERGEINEIMSKIYLEKIKNEVIEEMSDKIFKEISGQKYNM